MKQTIILFLSLFLNLALFAQSPLDEAKVKIDNGDFEGAKILMEQASQNKKIAQTAQYLYLKGVIGLHDGDVTDAQKSFAEALKKGDRDAAIALAKMSIRNYDVDSAEDYLANYKKLSDKNKKEYEEEYYNLERQIEIMTNSLDRVERIVVIDSINLNRDDFFKYYSLSPSSGSLKGNEEVDFNVRGMKNNPVFVSENDNYAMFSAPGKDGFSMIMEADRLTDGDWEIRESLQGDIEKTGDYNYPFMASDGVTLYFANDGEGSMGGYDIFVAQMDPFTGEFLQPLNMGMPYNSPFDDFMMAIDEENGIGWWATDRNYPGEDVTVYVFLINDIRENYSTDYEEIEAMAKITDFKATQPEEKQKEINHALKKIKELSR